MHRFIPFITICALVQPVITNVAIAQDLIPTVSFAKAMNPAFAEDYENQTIRTTVKFMAAGATEGYLWGAIPQSAIQGKVAFRVLEAGSSNSGPFGNLPPHVFITKEASDLVFELQQGDPVVLVGRPVIGKQYGMTQVVFLADSIAKMKVKK